MANRVPTAYSYRKNEKNQRERNEQLKQCLKTITLQDLDVKKSDIAKGKWGMIDVVQMRKKEWNDHAFVLKKIKRSNIHEIDRHHILNEKEILSCLQCDFIAKYHRTFQDPRCLYILMEFCPGGDLWSRCPVNDQAAPFYTACVVEALSYLHQRNIIHRDLKAENLVLDHKGYVKLIDFGLACRFEKDTEVNSFCGTAEFMAPEVVRCKLDINAPGYDETVDLWGLGQLVYFILTDIAAFGSDSRDELWESILEGMENNVVWCGRTSGAVRDLIMQLCQNDPTQRLGCKEQGGFTNLRQHRWFREICWDSLRDGLLPPPMVPFLTDPTDTRHFLKNGLLAPQCSSNHESENTSTVKHTKWAKDF